MFKIALFYYAFYFLISDNEGIKNLSSVFPCNDLVIFASKNINNPSLNPMIK